MLLKKNGEILRKIIIRNMETLDIENWTSIIAGKLFNNGCYIENYNIDLAKKKLSNCVGWHFLTEILIENEDIVKTKLISKTEYRE